MLKTVASAKLLILSISISLYVNVYAIHIHTSEITANFSLNTPWFVNYLKVGRKHNIQIFIYNISVCIYIYRSSMIFPHLDKMQQHQFPRAAACQLNRPIPGCASPPRQSDAGEYDTPVLRMIRCKCIMLS